MRAEIAAHQADIERVCRLLGVRKLALFGSAATGTDRQGESDLDFLVDFQDLPPGGYADAYFGLIEALEAMFGRPVDLVVESAIRNPYFREAVEQTKIPLYAA